MAFFERDPIILGGSSGGTQPGTPTSGILPWAPGSSYTDGQLVSLNGSLYQAIGNVPAGVVPPIEVASPLVPGLPRYRLVTRGRGPIEPFDPAKQYYQDARVTHNSGLFILEAPSVGIGSSPLAAASWVPEHGQLTAWEGQPLTAAAISSVVPVPPIGSLTLLQITPSDAARVKSHRLRHTTSTIVSGGAILGIITFPTPHPSGRVPRLVLTPANTTPAGLDFFVTPLINSLNQCTGYYLVATGSLSAGNISDVAISVDEYVG